MEYPLKRLKNRQKHYKLYRSIVSAYNSKCAICDWQLPSVTPNNIIYKQGGCDIHHIISYKEGGSETVHNLILLCPNCHILAEAGVLTRDQLRQTLRYEPYQAITWLRDNYKLLPKRPSELN